MNSTTYHCHYCGIPALLPSESEHIHDLSGDPICEDCAIENGYARDPNNCEACDEPRDGEDPDFCIDCVDHMREAWSNDH